MCGQALEALQPLWREFDVKRAWLFGGRARGEADADSDWDFLVEFASRPGFANFMGLKCALEDALGSKVDVLSRSAVKRAFLARIEKELVDLY
jgi:predicted nucleotidyltransferase